MRPLRCHRRHRSGAHTPSICWLLALAMLIGDLLCRGPQIRAADAPVVAAEHQIKAAYLFNFAKFVEWPSQAFASPRSPLVIGLVGEHPLESTLPQLLHGEQIRNRPLLFKRLASDEPPGSCHILFFSNAEAGQTPTLLAELKNTPVLTVGESEAFARAGGMINFVKQNRNVRFEVNLDAARQADLGISSKLLNSALKVHQAPKTKSN